MISKGKTGKKWHVDETYLKVKGHWCYLYRVIDRFGNLVDVRLSKTRDLKAAEAFFKQSLQTVGHTPEKITTDKHPAYPKAIRKTLGRKVKHRTCKYLNNRLEQDHRAVTQRTIVSDAWFLRNSRVPAASAAPLKSNASISVLENSGARVCLSSDKGASLKCDLSI